MKTTIYYFSATGNSLALTRKIAEGLGETEVIPIFQGIKKPVTISDERVGIIFPVYAFGMPRIVAEFVEMLKFQSAPYVFAVATAGGTPSGTLLQLQKLLHKHGIKLNAGFAVREASYALLNKSNPLISMIRFLHGKPPKYAHERLDEIIATVKRQENHKPETGSLAASFLGNLIHPIGISSFKSADKDFTVDDHCTHCQTCQSVCPRKNITIIDGHPSWNHDCELCYACLQWCPNAAIQYLDSTHEQKRSHHPEVAIQEMLLR